jgi:hypothetical protein
MDLNTTHLSENNRRRVEREAANLDLNTINESRNRHNNIDEDVKNAITNSVDLGDTPDFAANNDEKEIDNYLESVNKINNTDNEIITEDIEEPLTVKDKIFLFLALNFYEALFGYIVAIIFTLLWSKLLGINITDNFFDSFLKVVISITILSTVLLFVREFVDTLPVISDYKKRPGFYHPPPIALTFGLFRSTVPLGQRAKHVSNTLTKFIGTKGDSPWKKIDPEILKEIKSTNPTSFIIFLIIIFGLLFGKVIYNGVIGVKNKLRKKYPKKYNAKKDYKN